MTRKSDQSVEGKHT